VLGEFDRLVLLGDVVELLEGRPAEAMEVAEPVLRELGMKLGPEREVVLVAGNHDTDLVRPWVRAQGAGLSLDASVPLDATPELKLIASWLAPARVTARYPGLWVGEGTWATHGHYLDRHLLPSTAYGLARGLLGRLPGDGAVPADYERAGGPSMTRIEAFLTSSLPRPLAALWDDITEFLRAATMPGVAQGPLSSRLVKLPGRLLGMQMRRASLPALARVVHRLGVEAERVIFGHVHRCGPLSGDDEKRWTGPGGGPRMLNSGSWVYEPLLVHNVTPPHPYWPGGAVVVEPGREPRAIGLLDDLDAAVLREEASRALVAAEVLGMVDSS
jgi:hypothetical protein